LNRGVVTVVPVTSNVARIYPLQVLLPAGATGLAVASTAHAEQIRSVAVERFLRRLGGVSAESLGQLMRPCGYVSNCGLSLGWTDWFTRTAGTT
jgi:mRNA interferase MazF